MPQWTNSIGWSFGRARSRVSAGRHKTRRASKGHQACSHISEDWFRHSTKEPTEAMKITLSLILHVKPSLPLGKKREPASMSVMTTKPFVHQIESQISTCAHWRCTSKLKGKGCPSSSFHAGGGGGGTGSLGGLLCVSSVNSLRICKTYGGGPSDGGGGGGPDPGGGGGAWNC